MGKLLFLTVAIVCIALSPLDPRGGRTAELVTLAGHLWREGWQAALVESPSAAPPLHAAILWALAGLKSQLIVFQTPRAVSILYRLPSILALAGTAALFWSRATLRLATGFDRDLSRIGSLVLILSFAVNPALAYDAIFVGGTSAVPATAILGALLAAMAGRWGWALALAVAGSLLSPAAGVLLPLFALGAWRFSASTYRSMIRGATLASVPGVAAIYGVMLFPRRDDAATWIDRLARCVASDYGFNFYSALGDDGSPLGAATLGVTGSLLLAGTAVALAFSRCAWRLWTASKADGEFHEPFLICTLVMSLTIALFVPGLDTGWSLLALPPLLLLGLRSKPMFFCLWLLSLDLIVDQYYVLRWEALREPFTELFQTHPLSWQAPITLFSFIAKLTVLAVALWSANHHRHRQNTMIGAVVAAAKHARTLFQQPDLVTSRLASWIQRCPASFPLTPRDKAWLVFLTVLALAINLFDLGSMTSPQTGLKSDTEVELVFDPGELISEVWIYKNHRFVGLNVRCSGDGKHYRADLGYEYSYAWARKMLAAPCPTALSASFRLSSGAEVFELLFKAPSGRRIFPREVCDNGACRRASDFALLDENDLVAATPLRRDSSIFDEIFNTEPGIEWLRYPAATRLDTAHPFLGRTLIALSMKAFGIHPFAWRLPNALIGCLIPLLIFLFARDLWGDRRVAIVASLLSLCDFARVALSRVATVDAQLGFWTLLAYWLLFKLVKSRLQRPADRQTLAPLARRELGLILGSALALGAASGTKWIGFFAAPVFAVGLLITALWERPAFGPVVRPAWRCRWARIGLVYAVVPMLVYFAAYLPFLSSATIGGQLSELAEHQARILAIHTRVAGFNPYESKFPLWPLVQMPMEMHTQTGLGSGLTSMNFIMGHPLIWWLILPAVGLVCYVRRYRWTPPNLFIIMAFGAQFLPWLLVHRPTFIYHFFTASLFGLLLVAFLAVNVLGKVRPLLIIYVAAIVIVFVAFWPVVTGALISPDYVARLTWFDNWFLALGHADEFAVM